MIKPFFVFTLILFFSCSNINPKYEYLEKDDSFRKKITTGDFVELSHGFTYFETNNINNDEIAVFIHGFSVPSYIWDETYYESIERGLGAIRLDLYGRGNSSNPDTIYNDLLYANQVIELLDHLNIMEKVSLIGLSNGGRVISTIANLFPERVKRLVYVAPGGFHDNKTEPDKRPVLQSDVDAFIKDNYKTIAKGQMSDFKYPERFKGWDDRYEELLKFKGFANALISTSRNNYLLDDLNEQIGKTNIPQIFIWGDSDKVLPLDEVRDKLIKLMPKMKLFVIEDSGHLPHMEQKQSFDAIFFDQIFGISKYEISSSNGLKIFSESKAIFLDVRTRSENEFKSIPNSLLIPVSELPYRIDELLKFKEQDIVVYCRVGNRSGVATDYLTQNGYTAMNLLGGIEAWRGPTK